MFTLQEKDSESIAMEEHFESDTLIIIIIHTYKHKKKLARKQRGEKKRCKKVLDIKVDKILKSTDIDDPHMEFRTNATL